MANNDFDSEQRDILLERNRWFKKIKDRKEELELRRGGTKFLGDVGVRVLASYLERHMPRFLKVVKGPAFIVDFPMSEFDLLIVDEEATQAEFTNAYPKSKVRVIVEVKTAGLICKKSNVKTILEKNIVKPSGILKLPILYLSFIQSKSYIGEIRKALDDNVFILTTPKGNKYEPFEGEWKRFVDRILELSSTRAIPDNQC